MNETLCIKWDTGEMKINMNVFFPCTIDKLEKVCELIRMDSDNEDDLMDQLASHIQKRIEEFPETLEEKYRHHQKSGSKMLEAMLEQKNNLKSNYEFLQKARDTRG